MGKTGIEWSDETSNPIRVQEADGSPGGHWCQKSEPECAQCYAEAINLGDRFSFASGLEYKGNPPPLMFLQDEVDKWARKRKPRRIFVCSMTDLFGPWVKREWQLAVFDGAAAAPRQTIQLLTKWPSQAADASREWCIMHQRPYLPSNIHFGVTAGTQVTSERKLTEIKAVPAETKWVSVEPLLGSINYTLPEIRTGGVLVGSIPKLLEDIDWAVVGCETGPGARGHREYCDRALNVITQLRLARVKVFHKKCAIPSPVSASGWKVSRAMEEWDPRLRFREVL